MKSTYAISIEKSVYSKMKEIAVKERRSFSNMVEKILSEYIEKVKDKE